MTGQTPDPAALEPEAYIEALGDGPVGLGAILFTMVEPHRGWEVAYNRWYERDHFYDGCLVGAYNFAGGRWVATRRLKELRHLADDTIASDPLVGSYLSMYWIQAGHREDWNRWAFRQFRWLHEQGRMFPHRDHVHTLLYDHDWAVHRDPDPVPAALALDRRYPGVAVVIGEAADGDRASLDAWLRDEELPALLAGSPVASCLGFTPIPLLVDAEGVARDEGTPGRFLHLYFLDEDPQEGWSDVFAELPKRWEAEGRARVLWQGPFIGTIPGTDTYTDELW